MVADMMDGAASSGRALYSLPFKGSWDFRRPHALVACQDFLWRRKVSPSLQGPRKKAK